MEPFDRWAERALGPLPRLIALGPSLLLFGVVVPWSIVATARILDVRLGIPRVRAGPLNRIVAALVGLPGMAFSLWSIATVFHRGKGTPLPVLPTQRLVANGPYRYCRNPMSFGASLYYVGVSCWVGSLSALGLTGLFTASQLLYITLVEERELVDRFGEAYLDYMDRTPRYVPRLRR